MLALLFVITALIVLTWIFVDSNTKRNLSILILSLFAVTIIIVLRIVL